MSKYLLEQNNNDCNYSPDEAEELVENGYECKQCPNGNYKCGQKSSNNQTNNRNRTEETLPDVPFKTQATADKFRAWVIDNTDFENTAEGKGFNRSYKTFQSKQIKKAWKTHGQDFINATKYDPNNDTFPDDNGNNKGNDKTPINKNDKNNNIKNNDEVELKFDCNEKWEGAENYFIRDFGDNAAQASRDFMDYYVRLYPSQFVAGGAFYNKCGVSTTPPYIQGDEIHKNPVVKYIATQRKPYRDELTKKVVTDEIYNIFFKNYKGFKKVDKNADNNNQNQSKSTELQVLFTKGDGINTVLNRNEKPTRKACKELIDFYDNSYNNHYGEKEPNGYTRESFKLRMNDTKKAIFYCMKYHPFLSLDTQINKFRNVSQRDWYISLSNYSSNIIKENMENNIKQNLRQKLIETKLVKSLKTEIHVKSLDSIADDFYNRNYNRFFNRIFEHTKKLQNSRGYINEDVTDSFQNAFNTLFYGNESKMKEQTISHILKELKVDQNSEIGTEITNELNGVPDSEVSKLLTDPTFVADKIVSAVNNSVKTENIDDDSLESILRSTTVNKLKSTMDDVKFKIANRLTGVLDMTRQNVEDTSNEIKQSFIEKLSNKIVGI